MLERLADLFHVHDLGIRALCDQKPIRQDLLDQVVWSQILRLLEDPALIQNELNRRLEAARQSSPTQRRR